MSKQKMDERAIGYWKANISLIGILMAIWAFVSFGLGYLLANPLNGIHIGNVPLPFWMAQQGAIIVFVILIFTYAKLMDGIDAKFDVNE
ncbi:hypothetical protein OSCT_2495 [Oscillochloris trichoides DG-6]|uniref:Sodium symporter small subunit domain-containing protein n=1 Tax=Oscillochloris trichoides DG-6 TaxID=765420 RepID=E1IGP4_9CHLR|nr:DUF4212 domain-containing protein [Oscillochloris trichoides]EFO79631.1 hypothetical protein OSCT_2495 [Oscillochloris trichoides DG-6]